MSESLQSFLTEIELHVSALSSRKYSFFQSGAATEGTEESIIYLALKSHKDQTVVLVRQLYSMMFCYSLTWL